MATFRSDKKISSEAADKLAEIFGRLTITYDKSMLHAALPPNKNDESEWTHSSRYAVKEKTSTGVVVSAKSSLGEEDEITKITFDGSDRYWIPLGSSGKREYFDKIAEQGAAANP